MERWPLVTSMLGLLLLYPVSDGSGQTILSGTVREDSTDRPLPTVDVVLLGYGLQARTGATGRYELSGLPTGSHVVLFRAIGYHPHTIRVNLREGRSLSLDPTLIPSIVQLEEIEVRARRPVRTGLEAFEERRRMGFGKFIDSMTLRQSEHMSLPDLLRRRTLIDVRGGGTAFTPAFALSRRQRSRGACPLAVFVDGAPISRGAPDPLHVPVDINNFNVVDLAGVEVYSGPADTPVEFQIAGADCGTLVLWTRRSDGG